MIGRLALVVALLAAAPAGADELYSASAIVTGRDNLAERARGTREALLVVLARVAADPGVAAQALPEDPERYVLERRYTDRKAGVQISDEQGAEMGWEIVWEDDEWVLWRLPGTMAGA